MLTSCLNSCLDILQWWSISWTCKPNKALPSQVAFDQDVITATKMRAGHYVTKDTKAVVFCSGSFLYPLCLLPVSHDVSCPSLWFLSTVKKFPSHLLPLVTMMVCPCSRSQPTMEWTLQSFLSKQCQLFGQEFSWQWCKNNWYGPLLNNAMPLPYLAVLASSTKPLAEKRKHGGVRGGGCL